MNKPNLQSDSALYSLMLGAENELRKLRYSDSTIRHRWEVWKRYLKFPIKKTSSYRTGMIFEEGLWN